MTAKFVGRTSMMCPDDLLIDSIMTYISGVPRKELLRLREWPCLEPFLITRADLTLEVKSWHVVEGKK